MSGMGIPITSLLDTASSAANAPSVVGQASTPSTTLAPGTTTMPLVIPQLHMPTNEDDALKQTSGFDIAGLNAKVAAAQKVQGITQAAMSAQDDVYSQTNTAYDNLKKIDQYGGEKSGIMRIMGLFDPDWNAEVQRVNVQEAVNKGQQITERAKNQIDIANALPTVLDQAGAVSNKLMNDLHQDDTYKLAVVGAQQKQQELTIQQQTANAESARARAQMDEDQRAGTQFKVDNMATGDAQAALQDANTNPKSPWRNLGGLLQKRLTDEQAATANLENANNAAAKGDMETHNTQMQLFTNNLPASALAQAQQGLLASGAPTYTFGKGSKNPITVPSGYITAALNSQSAAEQTAQAELARQAADDARIAPRANELMGGASMLASSDPRAGDEAKLLAANVQSLGPKPTYPAIQGFKSILDNSQARLTALGESVANQYPDKAAQAAVKSAALTGKFTPEGGTAVSRETIGNWSATQNSPYASAWQVYNTALATQLKQGQVGGAGLSGGGSGAPMNTADELNAIMQGKSNPKFDAIRQNLLADPSLNASAAAAVSAKISSDAVEGTLTNLAHAPNASPLWQSILSDPTVQRGGTNAVLNRLEQERIYSGGKVDYSATFLNGLRQYATSVDNSNQGDPRYGLGDRALEAHLFGTRPHSVIVGGLVRSSAAVAQKLRNDYQDRINQDRSGATINQARGLATGMGDDPQVGSAQRALDPNMQNRPQPNPLNTPSATGLKLSVHDINSLYGGN